MNDSTFLRSVSPDRLAPVLGYGVSAPLLDRLGSSPRFRDRLAGLVASRLGNAGDLSAEQAKILMMQADEMIDLSNRAGCAWHAGSIIRVIDGPSRRLLVSLLGERNYELALTCSGLRLPSNAYDLAPEDIAKAVPIDGAACLAAWCEAQPRAVAARLRLVRPLVSPESTHEAWGPQVIARLLAD